ncbi:MAG: winged helix DNA-binding domain-containing protein [Anaerosomatales bacterium]|nr:winged helix DNA-binding domain-containing protein [Anaerosomatales bacterium]MDT8433834.1 winged helix DNA-binding domain-containing protein [Anaerosomatales bacterium]
MSHFDFTELLGADPLPWLLASLEPYTVWATLTGIIGLPPGDPDVGEAHLAVVQNEAVRRLVDRLPAWEAGKDVTGHHSPEFLPNRLNLLADMGVASGDFPRVEELLDGMLAQQDARGRFHAAGSDRGRPKPESGSLLCDTNVIADVLLRFGRGEQRGVQRALERMTADLASTPQGRAWQCVPEQRAFFRMPGRGADVCPQVTLEGLRAFSQLSRDERPPRIAEAARTPLEVWRRRTEERPYDFGHGYQFKSVKWPNFWYDVLWVLETVGRYPELWRGPRARADDRRSVAELAACLIAYNFDEDGRVTPRRVYRGFADLSFGQKHEPSPFATARCLIALSRVAELADEIASIDVEALPSSRSATIAAQPPRRRDAAPCPVPATVPSFPMARAVTRVLARQHLGDPWEPASIETVVADVVGTQFTVPATPYLALSARLDSMTPAKLDSALYQRRSLSRIRCMRGMVYAVRTDMVPVVFAATNRPVVNYARTYASFRGVSGARLEQAREAILDALADGPLTTAAIREKAGLDLDIAAAVNVMCAEGTLLRDCPVGDWRDRRATYIPFADALPTVRLDSVRRDDADVALTRAHVRAFGPVLFDDTAWWTGIGRKRTRKALETLGDEIAPVVLLGAEGEFLMHAADVDELASVGAPPSPSVALLPCLDPLLMGYRKRGRFLDDEHRPYVFDSAGRATSVVLVDGRIAGVWDSATDPEPAVLVHHFGEPGADAVSTVAEQAARTGRFLHGEEVPVVLVGSMDPLTGRPAGAVFKPLR